MKPFLFRFQVRPHTRTDDNQGNTNYQYGDPLWEEPPGRESSWTMPMRISCAMACLEGFEREGKSVALGTVSIFTGEWIPDLVRSYAAR